MTGLFLLRRDVPLPGYMTLQLVWNKWSIETLYLVPTAKLGENRTFTASSAVESTATAVDEIVDSDVDRSFISNSCKFKALRVWQDGESEELLPTQFADTATAAGSEIGH